MLACFWQPLESPTKHLVTAAKVIEYALLAPAAVLLFRRAVDLDRFLAVFVAWAAAAGVWGLLQFLGVVNEFNGRRTGQREVSFMGHQDLGGFTGAALAIGFAAIVLGERKRLAWVAVVGGALGVTIDASVFAYLGAVLAAVAAALVARRLGTLTARRLLALATILLVVGSGVYVLRGSDVSNYLSFLGISKSAQSSSGVQTGSQRTMLLWIGWRMWVDHPMLGVGFERSNTDFQPYLAAAKRKFPDQPRRGLPVQAAPVGGAELLGPAARRHGHRRLPARRRDVRDRSSHRAHGRAPAAVLRTGGGRVGPGCGRHVECARDRRRDPDGRGHLARARARRRRLGDRMSRVLVTGGAGFIGSNLVQGLLEAGNEVRVLDNFSTGSRRNLDGVEVEIVEGELRSYERVHNAVREMEVVFHLGALGSVPRSVQDPLTSSAVNVEGTLNVLLAARDAGVRRVVYSSSTSVYGSSAERPTRRNARPTRSRRTALRSSPRSGTA